MNEYTNYLTRLSTEFHKYLMENGQFADRIPEGALIIFQIRGEKAFNEWHETVSLTNREPDQPVIYIRMRKWRRRSLLEEVVVSSADNSYIRLKSLQGDASEARRKTQPVPPQNSFIIRRGEQWDSKKNCSDCLK